MNKKFTILFVLKSLENNSSKEKPLSQSLMARSLELLGVKCDRKTIARDIKVLKEFGYNIQKVEGRGFYLVKEKEKN